LHRRCVAGIQEHSAEICATVDFIDAGLLSGFQHTLNISEAFEDANFRKASV
jgi:hypothetical protein